MTDCISFIITPFSLGFYAWILSQLLFNISHALSFNVWLQKCLIFLFTVFLVFANTITSGLQMLFVSSFLSIFQKVPTCNLFLLVWRDFWARIWSSSELIFCFMSPYVICFSTLLLQHAFLTASVWLTPLLITLKISSW